MFVPTLINLLYNLSFSNKYFIRFRGNKQKRKMNKTKNEKANNINNPKSGNQETWLIVFGLCSSFRRCT